MDRGSPQGACCRATAPVANGTWPPRQARRLPYNSLVFGLGEIHQFCVVLLLGCVRKAKRAAARGRSTSGRSRWIRHPRALNDPPQTFRRPGREAHPPQPGCPIAPGPAPRPSHEDIVHHLAMNVGETELPSLKAIRQLLVIQP